MSAWQVAEDMMAHLFTLVEVQGFWDMPKGIESQAYLMSISLP